MSESKPRPKFIRPNADERELLSLYHQEGSQAAREALIIRFTPLAKSLARRYYKSGESSYEDLLQVATVGLLNAIDRFNPERETAFSSFAVPTILGELKRYFRDKSWAVRVPRELQEMVLKVDRVIEEFTRTYGSSPTPGQIAKVLEIEPEQVVEALEAAAAYRTSSLDQAVTEDEPGVSNSLGDKIGDEDPAFEQTEHSIALGQLLDELPEREQEILKLRFFEDLSQSEIAEQMGCSQMHVSRMLRQALHRLSVLARDPMLEQI